MKNCVFFLLFLGANFCFGQAYKPPKLTYKHGFLTSNWAIGQKTVERKEVDLHLKNTSPDAYNYFRIGTEKEIYGIVWDIGFIGGMATGLIAKKTQVKLTGYIFATICGVFSLTTEISSKKNFKKSVSTYNTQFGY